ncbi:DUF3180 domain-containing protein [Kocuria sp. p3-SID1433]|uniref:DUF3180 domain-containing protein n=1 Tax=unclassified Kocuria TaxID=2649579 RepID=UPI0021A6F6AA|nr:MULTISPECIES: DUF3180 domain-containing protein [unclassified Kocuria]MCT1602758.1 DUF3180 domain-containing protein [Kocuria sp. p3-SID1428]MCT2179955.1 DUF3180 domain-containing protein [Kocuria sp. p3-SID1433]
MVKGLTVRLLAVLAAAAFMAGWIAQMISGAVHGPLLALPVASGIALLVFAAILLIAGLRVRRLRDGDREVRMDRTWGTVVAALAQAVAVLGALCLGWHAMLAVDQAALISLRTEQGPLWRCLFQVGVGAALAVIGWTVERFCRIPPEDPEAEADGATERGPGRTAEEGGLARGRD